MYYSHGWWFPDQDTHFNKMLSKNVAKGGLAVYQQPARQASLTHCHQRKVAIDIGANVGLWTQDLCKTFDQVHAIEPVADFRLCLAKNVQAANLHVHACALGAEDSMINMVITADNTGHSHVDPGSLGVGGTPMHTLDRMQLPMADYIKLDCEGYEHNIILGGEAYIRACRPIMVVEQKFHQDTGTEDQGQAVALLYSWGARLLQQKKHDLILGW